MQPYTPSDNERDAPIQHRTDMNPNALPPTAADFPPLMTPEDQDREAVRQDDAPDPSQGLVSSPRDYGVTLTPFERPDAPAYEVASPAELEDVRRYLCGDYDDPNGNFGVAFMARALWNEIHRLRTVNAAYIKRHREQERSIVTARAERDQYKSLGNLAQTVTGAQDMANTRLMNERTDLTLKLADAHEALTLITEQRNAARAELQARADEGMEIARLRGELEAAVTELNNFRSADQSELNAAYVAGLEDRQKSWVKSDPEKVEMGMQDFYVGCALPALMTIAHAGFKEMRDRGSNYHEPPEPALHAALVREARAIATEAVKQAREANDDNTDGS